jgi:hypothetical protein
MALRLTLCTLNSVSKLALMFVNTTVTCADRMSCTIIKKQLRVAVASTPTTEAKSSTYSRGQEVHPSVC